MPGTLRTVDPELELVTATVVPTHVVGRLMVDGGSQLCLAGGVPITTSVRGDSAAPSISSMT